MINRTIQTAFDVAADTYDKDFTHSNIGRMQRKRVWAILGPLLQSYNRPLHILEINCGTGEDALQLAKLGHHIIATDASRKMIEKARQKITADIPGNLRPRFLTCSFNSLADLRFETPFDLVISNFGGLNCVNETAIRQLSAHLANITAADGKLFLVVMSKQCIWEILYYSMKGKFGDAFRRRQPSVNFRLEEREMQIYYYAPSHLKKLFQKDFLHVKAHPVGLFIPPSYLEKAFVKHIQFLRMLNQLEANFGFTALSFLADHYCTILTKQTTL